MTAPLRSTPHSQLPASQTAPVAEFRCLYTPDIRKKQKKWHDGYLKFHSFNSRVMVYDQARNFLGDTYYKDSDQLHEGDELTLDKGVMVEVADAIGVTQADLKPLFEKKPKEAPPPPTAPPRRFQPPSQIARPQVMPAAHAARANAQQPRHKALSTLLGTPKGPIGKSVPIKSPYDARQEEEREKENHLAVESSAKRQKTTHGSTGSAGSAMLRVPSTGQEDSPAPKRTLAMPTKPANPKIVRAARPVPQEVHVITLDDNDVSLPPSSPPSLPGTPSQVSKTTKRTAVMPASRVEPVTIDQPAVQTPRIPRGKVPVPSVKAARTPQAPAPPSSPPVSASNRLTNVDFAIEFTPVKKPAWKPPDQPVPAPSVESALLPQGLKAKSLRLSKGVKRGTLMICQPQPPPPRSRGTSEVQPVAAKSTTRTESAHERYATSATKTKRKLISENGNPVKPRESRQESPANVLDIEDDDQETILGSMDQRLLVAQTSSPEALLLPASPEKIVPTAKVSKAIDHLSCKARAPPPKLLPPESSPAPVITKDNVKQKSAQEIRTARKATIKTATTVARQNPPSRVTSPALSAISGSRPRTSSTSPRKLAALSTGGFRRKGKTATSPPNAQTPVNPTAVPRNETVALPPHPLHASKNGPVMTTTELAAMLQQPKRKLKATADPIEDQGDTAGVSSNRKFRRVRSENDTPIPSTSEDWEKRNLPKAAATDVPDVPSGTGKIPDVSAVTVRKKSELAALIKKTDPRRQLVRTQSLTIDSNVTHGPETESPTISPITDKDTGPWSTEAFDLFGWRPPREELGI